MQRINEEVPRKSFLERLYTKNLETQQLVDSMISCFLILIVKGVFNTQNTNEKVILPNIGSLNQYDNLFSAEESEEEREGMEESPMMKNPDLSGKILKLD